MDAQMKRTLDYLESGRKLTVKIAMEELGIGCFTKTVSKLRRNGYPIRGEWTSSKNRYGEKVRYMVYTLDKEAGSNASA